MDGFRWPGFESLRKLSDEEAMQLAARVAELSKAGLPLGPGLRALAAELPGRRLPNVLHGLADRLDAGDDLLVALEKQGASLPSHLRGLMLAGIRSGRLSEVLEEFIDLYRSRLELRRRVWLTLAYPSVLLLTLGALSILARLFVLGQFTRIFADFGVALPAMTIMVIHGAGPVMWLSLALIGAAILMPVMLWLAPGVRWAWPVLHRLPMLGPLLRYGHLGEFSRLMSVLLKQRVALPDALRLTAAGLRDANLARGCRAVADDVDNGWVLYESMAQRRQFPTSMIPVVEWGQRAPALADAFVAAAEMFEGRMRTHGTLLEALLLPIMFLAIIILVGFFVVAMFLPLISLISHLSGGI